MKMRFRLIVAGLVLVLVMSAGIGSAWAYFTTYDEASGGVQVVIDTHMDEKVDTEKHVTITNDASSSAFVWVRARAYIGGKYGIDEGYPNGDGWTNNEDGWSYYASPIAPAESTNALNIKISGIPEADKSNLDDIINVAVVYECIPASFDENGDPVPANAADADWTVTSREEAK